MKNTRNSLTKKEDTTATAASQTQVGGNHYTSKAVQPWDAMQAWMRREAFEGFLLGSAIAYLARVNTEGVNGKGGPLGRSKSPSLLRQID